MEYTKKNKNLIARLFKKAGMIDEAEGVLSCDEFNHEIASAMRDAARIAKVGIGTDPEMLDAARRYETRHCAIFKECTMPHCEGAVWCKIYNLGGSHGYTGDAYRHLGNRASNVLMSKVMNVCRGELKFSKTNSSRVLGVMNDHIQHQKYAFWDRDRPVHLQDRCNRYMPSRGFPDGIKEYKFPIEVFAQTVKEQFDLDFTPHKEDFYEKIHGEDPFDLEV